jgi:hypothetical protein
MRDEKALEDATKLFARAEPCDLADEREAVLANMRRLRAERLAREAKDPPRRYQTKRR